MSAYDTVSPLDPRLTPDKRRTSHYWQRAQILMQEADGWPSLSEDERCEAVDRAWLLAEGCPLIEAVAMVAEDIRP